MGSTRGEGTPPCRSGIEGMRNLMARTALGERWLIQARTEASDLVPDRPLDAAHRWTSACVCTRHLRSYSPAVGELAGARAREPPAQPAGEAALKLEVSLRESAPLRGIPGLWSRSTVGGHQVGQTGSLGPHAGGQRRIASRALRLELRLANCSRNAHLTPPAESTHLQSVKLRD